MDNDALVAVGTVLAIMGGLFERNGLAPRWTLPT